MASSGETVTYRELDERSNRLAQLWYARGLRPGDHVAILLENDPRWFDAVWARLRSGLYYTPVNWHLTAPEVAYIVGDCGARSVVDLGEHGRQVCTSSTSRSRWCSVARSTGGSRFEDAVAAYPTHRIDHEPEGAGMFYSSGTTGRPKGIVFPLPDRDGAATTTQVITVKSPIGHGPDSVYLSPGPMYHTAPVVTCSFVHRAGGTTVVMERWDPEACLAAVERYRCDRGQFVPTMFVRLLKLPPEVRDRYDVSSLEQVTHAAAPCPVDIKHQMMDWWGPIIWEYYAGSENVGSTIIGPDEWLAHPGSVGQPRGTTVHICDDDQHELPIGEVGNIWFESPWAAFEYHGDPAKTAASRSPEGWFNLGDVGYLDDEGYLYLTDRQSFTIIAGGVNIYPQEAEDVLVMHPGVADVAVFGVPNDDLGEEVKAVVQLLDHSAAGPEMEAELLAFCRRAAGVVQVPTVDRLRRGPPPAGHRQALQATAQGPLLGRPRLPDRVGPRTVPDRSTSFPDFTPTSGELIKAAAAKRGDKVLAILGDDRLTYAAADARSAELGKALLASGAGKGTRIGLLFGNSPDWIVGWLGITRIGAVAVLLNTYGKAKELAWVLRHADVQVLLTVDAHLGHDYLERLEQAIPGLADQTHERIFVESHPYLRTVWTWGDGRRPWAAPVADLLARASGITDGLLRECEAEVTPADPMAVVYSSGSTSDPKGAIHAHGPAVRHAHNLWQMRDLIEDDVLYTPMPLFWVGGFSFTLIAAIHAGATLVFEEQFEPSATLALIERERITQVLGWPHMAKALVDHPSFKDRDLSSIRGGSYAALLPPDQQADAELPKANSLGMTETLGPHTFDSKEHPLPPEKDGSFGFSVPGVEHKIVDPVTLEDVPVGRDRRAVAARLLADARAPQEGAGRHVHARRLVPHGRRRPLRRGRALLLHRSDGRPHQVGRHEHHAARRRARARSHARGDAGLRGRDPGRRAGRGRGGGHRAPPRRDARRGRGAQARQGGDRQLQGAAPRRRLRRPDRAALARLRQDRPPRPDGHPRRALRRVVVRAWCAC